MYNLAYILKIRRFEVIQESKLKARNEYQYFCRIPKNLINNSTNKKLLLTIIYLDRRRSYEDWVGLSVHDLIIKNNYKVHRGNQKIITEFKTQLNFLKDNEMIEFESEKLPYILSDHFNVRIVNDFNLQDGYVVLTAHEIDTLLIIPFDTAKVFFLYLYIKSFIFQKPRNKDNEFHCDYKTDNELKPSAFFSDVRKIPFDTGLSNNFVCKCLSEFVNRGLFVKKEVGSYRNQNGERMNVPNIYVENNEWAEEEIKLTLKRYKYMYGTDKFEPLLKRRRKE